MKRIVIALLTAFSLCHSAVAQLVLVSVLRDETALTGAHDIGIRNGIAYIAGKGFTSPATRMTRTTLFITTAICSSPRRTRTRWWC